MSSETQGQALKRRYEVLEAQHEEYAELFALVQSRPENEAYEIVRRIKMGTEVGSVLRHVKEADLLIQLTLIPESRRRYSLLYIKSMPAFLLVPDNEYLLAPLYQANFDQTDASRTPEANMDQSMRPYRAAEIVEHSLDRVFAKDWTSLMIDNGLSRRLIALYLMHQHATYHWFNKSLFLEDMAGRNKSFCSSLLVHAVLAAGCQAYKGIETLHKVLVPGNLQTQLLLEAKRLWELDEGKDRITSIHAAMVLHGTLNGNGMDQEGKHYTSCAIAMANSLKLFESPPPQLPARVRRGREYTAWALWAWQTSLNYSFQQVPVLKLPPHFPAPHPAMDPSWYGEIYLRYPMSSVLTPIHNGLLFKESIDFRLILAEITLLQYTQSGTQKMTQEQLSELVSKLGAWLQNLPTPLQARNATLPCQLKIHADYQMVLHSLVQTQLSFQSAQSSPFLLDDRRSALQIRNDAHIRLETLMRLWYLRHSFSSYEPWALLFLVYLGNLAIQSLNNEDSDEAPLAPLEVFRSTVVLLINGSDSQSHSYYLGALVSRSMIERLRPEDAERMGPHLAQSSRSQVEGPFDSAWPLPNIKIVDEPDKHSLNDLLKEFREVALENQKPAPSQAQT